MLYRLRDQTLIPRVRRPGDGRRRIAGGVAVSLLLHTVILAALLVHLKWEPESEQLPPPATVSMIFEGGRPQGPTSPEPTKLPGSDTNQLPLNGNQQGAPASAAPETQPATPNPPSPEVTSQPLAPSLPVQRQAATPPAEPAEPPSTATPVPSTPQPSTPPEPEKSEVTVPPPQPAPAAPTSKPQTWPLVRQAAPARPPSDFPAPMDFSLGKPPAKSTSLAMGKPLLSLTLPNRGPADPTPYSFETNAEMGTDWRNAFSQWVEEHSYYPNQAAELGQQGTVRVGFTILPDGHVTAVELERGSGSPWLDLGLEEMFMGAHLPPLPKSAAGPIPFHFTMHYIIVR